MNQSHGQQHCMDINRDQLGRYEKESESIWDDSIQQKCYRAAVIITKHIFTTLWNRTAPDS